MNFKIKKTITLNLFWILKSIKIHKPINLKTRLIEYHTNSDNQTLKEKT